MSEKETKRKALTDEQLAKTSGGDENLDYWFIDDCSHPDKTPTNQYKEEPYFIFWTKRVRKWHCNVCNQDIWLEV